MGRVWEEKGRERNGREEKGREGKGREERGREMMGGVIKYHQTSHGAQKIFWSWCTFRHYVNYGTQHFYWRGW